MGKEKKKEEGKREVSITFLYRRGEMKGGEKADTLDRGSRPSLGLLDHGRAPKKKKGARPVSPPMLRGNREKAPKK